RRRHTRFSRDWSSDVCSSDLFLMDHLRFPWHEVDALAHELEHSMPPVVVDRMDELLGFPLTCPHGHPIPRADGTIMYIPSEPLRSEERRVGRQCRTTCARARW